MNVVGAKIVDRKNDHYTVVVVQSESNPAITYNVDVVNGRCSCPGWIYRRGHGQTCKHLRGLGFKPKMQMVEQDVSPVQDGMEYL